MDIFNNRIVKRIILVITIIVAVLAFVSILRAGLALWLYSYIAKWATVRLGLDYYLAELVAVALTSAAMFMLPGIGCFILSRKQRLIGMASILGCMVLVSLLVYTIGRNVYFNRTTGESLRYYADTPEGREFSFTPGFHPKYGIEYKPYTREVINQELEQMRRKEAEQQKLEAAGKKRLEAEMARREQEERRLQEIKQQRLEAESRRQQKIERQKMEASRTEQEIEQQRLIREEKNKHPEQQKIEADQRREQQIEQERQRRLEQQRWEQETRRQKEIEERERADERRRRQEEDQRRKQERNEKILRTATEVMDRLQKRRPY